MSQIEPVAAPGAGPGADAGGGQREEPPPGTSPPSGREAGAAPAGGNPGAAQVQEPDGAPGGLHGPDLHDEEWEEEEEWEWEEEADPGAQDGPAPEAEIGEGRAPAEADLVAWAAEAAADIAEARSYAAGWEAQADHLALAAMRKGCSAKHIADSSGMEEASVWLMYYRALAVEEGTGAEQPSGQDGEPDGPVANGQDGEPQAAAAAGGGAAHATSEENLTPRQRAALDLASVRQYLAGSVLAGHEITRDRMLGVARMLAGRYARLGGDPMSPSCIEEDCATAPAAARAAASARQWAE